MGTVQSRSDVFEAVERLRYQAWELRLDLEEGNPGRGSTLERVRWIEERLEELRDELKKGKA
jgi:hypothetical protein